jgi:zinc protease
MRKICALFVVITLCVLGSASPEAVALEPVSLDLKIQTIETSRGIKAWFIRDTSSPVIALSFAFKGGSLADPKGKEGVARLTAALLLEGAGDLDKAAFSAKLEDLAVSIEYQVSHDAFSCTLQTLKDKRTEAFRLLKLTLHHPQLTTAAFERTRNQLFTSLATALQNPTFIASRALHKSVFENYLYSRPTEGTLDSVREITLDDIKIFLKDRFAQDNLVIGVTGDCDTEEVKHWLDDIFGDLPEKSSVLGVKTPAISSAGKTIVIEKAFPQSTIHFAQEGITFNHPDYLRAIILTTILGGGPVSRLNEEIREKRGLAYYITANLEAWQYSGWVHGTLSTVNKQVKEALTLVRKEWQRIHDTGVTAEELANAKTYYCRPA